jgi:hypothetical protein
LNEFRRDVEQDHQRAMERIMEACDPNKGSTVQSTGCYFTDEPKPVNNLLSILAEADKAVNGERQENYGSQTANFSNIAAMWSVLLDVTVTPQQVAMCMIALKLARLKKTGGLHRDSVIDIAGYAECLEKVNHGF